MALNFRLCTTTYVKSPSNALTLKRMSILGSSGLGGMDGAGADLEMAFPGDFARN